MAVNIVEEIQKKLDIPELQKNRSKYPGGKKTGKYYSAKLFVAGCYSHCAFGLI